MEYTTNLIASYSNHALDRDSSSSAAFKEPEKRRFLQLLGNENRVTILEIGCGPGQDARFFQDRGLQVVATDNVPAMVELTAEKGVEARVLDCYDLDQMDETFDAVYSMNCLLHIPQRDILTIFDAIAARLHDRGLMYLGLWCGDDFEGVWDKDHYDPKRFFSFRKPETLLAAVRRAFDIEYFREIEPRPGASFASLIARKRAAG